MDQVDDNVFLAKLAVYSRERAFMKDMPAALLPFVLAQPRQQAVPSVIRSRGRQRPRAAHAVPDAAFGTVRPQELVEFVAAGVPALAEQGVGRYVAFGFDR